MRNKPVAPIINFLPIEEVKKSFQVIKQKLLRKFDAKIRYEKANLEFICNYEITFNPSETYFFTFLSSEINVKSFFIACHINILSKGYLC